MIRLVLFDIDGTLIHSGGAGVKAFGRAFAAEFGLAHGTEQMRFAGRTDTGLAREFFRLHQIEPTPKHFRRFFDCYVFWLDQLLHQTGGGTCPGAAEFLGAVEARPHRPLVGLLTGNIRLGAEIKLRHFGLWERFVTGGFADDHENRDHIAHAAAERGRRLLGGKLRGEEILVIGDTPLDIQCGRAIGAKVLAVATGGANLAQLQPHAADWLVEDLRGVSATEICG